MAANGHQTHTYVIAANGSAIADVAAQNQVTSPIMGSDDGDFNQRRSSGESDSQQFHMIHHPNHQNHHHQQMNHQRQNVFSERSIDHINHGIDMKQGQPQMVCTSATANFHYNPQELAEMSEEKRQEMLMLMELELIISKNIAEGLVWLWSRSIQPLNKYCNKTMYLTILRTIYLCILPPLKIFKNF